jgi:hypothetical protein
MLADPDYSVAPLSLQRVAQAYPLVQSRNGEIAPEDWIRYASSLIQGEEGVAASGVLVAEQKSGVIAGLCTYRACADLTHTRTLRIEHFIVLSIFDQPRVARQLALELEGLAQILHCQAIHTEVPLDAGEIAGEALAGLGHLEESRVLCKSIAGTAS